MVGPAEDGGLGLDPATVAAMVGHDDGGYLIATAYQTRPSPRPRRAQRAMNTYQQISTSERSLHFVVTDD